MDENFARGDQRPLVLHVISGLGTGGAELMLARLVKFSRSIRHAVVSLRTAGPTELELRKAGAAVHSLGLPTIRRTLSAPFALRAIARGERPSLVQGWMTHGNLAAVCAAAAADVPLLWNVRQSLVDFKYEKRLTSAALRLTALLSNRPAAILYNSEAGAQQHEALGYPHAHRKIIVNGFDTTALGPNEARRNAVRKSLGIRPEAVVVGLIARAHPMKNHSGFFEVARVVSAAYPNAEFLLAGNGTDGIEMRQLAETAGVSRRCLFLGDRTDIPDITRSLDVAVSLSVHGEGFPNTVGEAMASGVPCVVTDVGDSAWVLGDAGVAVPRGNLAAAASAIGRLTQLSPMERSAIGAVGRARVCQNFGIESVVSQYEQLYMDVIARGHAALAKDV